MIWVLKHDSIVLEKSIYIAPVSISAADTDYRSKFATLTTLHYAALNNSRKRLRTAWLYARMRLAANSKG